MLIFILLPFLLFKPLFNKLTPLEKYYRHGCLGKYAEDRYDAGKRIYEDFYKSGLSFSGAVNYEKPRVDCSPKRDLSPNRIHHLEAFSKAIKSIKSLKALDILYSVVMFEKDLHLPYASKNWKIRQYNKQINTMLCEALDDLVKHYAPRRIKQKIVGFSKVKII